MQTSLNAESPHSEAPHLLRSGVAILLALAWVYLLAWALFFAVAALQPDAGGWELEEWLVSGALLVPLTLIPLYLGRCARRKQSPSLKRWLPWIFRVMCLSIVLAMLDSWAAGTERRAPLFSVPIWAMSDGGTRGSVGFGYSLTYYRRMGGVHGPEVWFWFTPFIVSATTEHVGLRWVGQH